MRTDAPFLRALAHGGSIRRWIATIRLLHANARAANRRQECAARLGVPIPQALILSLTTRCPEACVFCGTASAAAIDLDADLASRIVAEAERLGIFAVVLVGGEPYLRSDLVFRLVGAHPRMLFLVFTGGAGMTPAMARRACAPNLWTLVGNDDGRTRANAARRALHDAGASFGFSAVVSEENALHLSTDAFVSRMRDTGSRVGIFLERLPAGRAANLGYGLRAASRAHFRREVAMLESRWRMPLRFLPDGEDEFGGCVAAGRGILYVDASGTVRACPFAASSSCGSLRETTLAEALRAPSLAEIRLHAARAEPGADPCALLPSQSM